jgi:hypothetical protein
MLDATDGPQAVALNQHRHSIQKHVPICAKRVKECAPVSTKSMVTSRAVITMFDMTIDFDVVSTYFPEIPTEFLVAPLSLSVHRASPRSGRCAHHTSKMGFPGLGVQHPVALGTLIGLAPACSFRVSRAHGGLPLRVLPTSGAPHRHSIISSFQVFATGQIMTRDGPSNVDEAAEAANRLMHGRSS